MVGTERREQTDLPSLVLAAASLYKGLEELFQSPLKGELSFQEGQLLALDPSNTALQDPGLG